MSKPVFRMRFNGELVDAQIIKVLKKRGTGPIPEEYVVARMPDGSEMEVAGLWLPSLSTLTTDADGNVNE